MPAGYAELKSYNNSLKTIFSSIIYALIMA